MSGIDTNTVYLIVGTLVLTNIGAIGSALFFLVKFAWAASAQKAKYDMELGLLKKDVDAAHEKIRRLDKI